MATEQQKQAFNIRTKTIEKKKPILMGKIMREAGYSNKASENPKRLINSIGWQELLSHISDEKILKKLKAIAFDTQDKRACLDAIEKLLKLKDKYPANKYKAEGFDNELKGFFAGIEQRPSEDDQ